MPLYEYRCSTCRAEFEALVSRSETDPVECEKCGSSQTTRIASTFSCCSTGESAPAGMPGGC